MAILMRMLRLLRIWLPQALPHPNAEKIDFCVSEKKLAHSVVLTDTHNASRCNHQPVNIL